MVKAIITRAAPRSNNRLTNWGLLVLIDFIKSRSAISWKKLLNVISVITSNCFPTNSEIDFGIIITSKKTS
jgi:hypothetical protein